MPAGVVAGFITYLSDDNQLGLPIWNGEVPRFNTNGDPITIPGSFPAFTIEMTEQGLSREGSREGEGWTFNKAYEENGMLIFSVMNTTDAAVQTTLSQLEAILCEPTNWPNISLPGGPIDNPFYVIGCLWHTWSNRQMVGLRTQDSQLIWLGQVLFHVSIHGALA